ncbi:ferric reductase [Nocardioides sp.]|uniref:ferric reductase n=1 Tax=Nocardioides sp. TaxID=35761 RepID=UPI0035193E2B
MTVLTITEGPLLWYLNRASGLSLMIVLSASVVLGVLARGGRTGGDGGARVPRFVTQSLHRNLALGGMLLLLAHIATAVVDEYVDIRWADALLPWGSAYEPWWVALGTIASDLFLVVTLTSALRLRLGHRAWKTIHLASWLAWGVGVAHGIGIGTDLRDQQDWVAWSVLPTIVCVLAVLAALGWRLDERRRGPRDAAVAPTTTSREAVHR